MQGGRDDGVVVADRLRSEPLILHDAVQLVELAGTEPGELGLAQRRPDRPLDLRLVVADRRRRAVQSLALVEPEVEELAEGRPHAVLRSAAVTGDHLPEHLVCIAGAAVEGLAQLQGAILGITAEVDPQFPDPVTLLALGPTHRPPA